MKQFSKYGVAAAVSAIAASQVAATAISEQDLGDAAIVPYYTVQGPLGTGVHIINTSESTQVVKFRMRRAKDSRDALDFNIIMSPKDEWTAFINDFGDDIRVTTTDTTCTAPDLSGAPKQFTMPSTGINARSGAEEGYIEIIGMGQSLDESQQIAVNAKHTAGVPKSCSTVEQNFFRLNSGAVAAKQTTNPGVVGATRGVHNSSLTSNGSTATVSTNVFVDTPNVLKVSYFVRDEATGLEFGDNAVHIEDLAAAPMMTNQQLLGFVNGLFTYDPFNFELPNLGQGAYDNADGRYAAHNGLAGGIDSTLETDQLYNDLRVALGATSVINDWSADFATQESRTVTSQTDWVVTLPGQYTMQDPVCALYAEFGGATTCGSSTTVEDDDLPVVLSSVFYDREEGQESVESGGLSVSPGGTGSNATELPNEVNVIVWSNDNVSDVGVLGSAAESNVTGETIKFDFDVTSSGFSNGWAALSVSSANTQPETFVVGDATLNTGDPVPPTTTADKSQSYGAWVSVSTSVPIIGMTVWKRTFSDNANASYARAIEHSYTS